jgi:hypothetical protein
VALNTPHRIIKSGDSRLRHFAAARFSTPLHKPGRAHYSAFILCAQT